MDRWLINGKESLFLNANDRGLAYGDGVFETIAVRGSRGRFLDKHLSRLNLGCERLKIPTTDLVQLPKEIKHLIDINSCNNGVLKIIVTRGISDRGYYYNDATINPSRLLGISNLQSFNSPNDIKVRYCTTIASRNSKLAGIKSLNRLPQVLARAECDDENYDEGIMFDELGNAIGGTMTNIFIVHGQKLITPPVHESGIAGIMRDQIMVVSEKLGIKTNESYFDKSLLENAQEVFLSNSLIGIWPVNNLENVSFSIGPITKSIQSELFKLGVIECQP
ncbi:MAG: aminodeoxychorismate lyase [Pseudomonadota bacterium]|nr:aminodeoxychorismate lyase [Pseudomonadota bacterium]